MTKPRILVADDHTEMRHRIATLLEAKFDVVATVANGQAAVEAAGSLLPDLVVLDIAMPVLNGFEAAAIIRDLPDAPRIVFCTASDDPEFAKAALALGASACVLKRNLLVELVSMVQRALKVHAVFFYEMVDLLWKDDKVAAAMSLEILWNQFIGQGTVLLCIRRAGHSHAGHSDGYHRAQTG